MSYVRDDGPIGELYDHAMSKGFSTDLFLCSENQDRYISTLTDAYRDYPLFTEIFEGKFDEKTFTRMMSVDIKSRLGIMAGLASSADYESVMLLEPPKARKTRMRDYFRVADAGAYTLLLKPEMYRLEDFEKFALDRRREYLDDKTWYIYIFATGKNYQGRGYGRKLMDCVLTFADENGSRICLETNSKDNVGLYRHFGFNLADSSVYKDSLEHYVMLRSS